MSTIWDDINKLEKAIEGLRASRRQTMVAGDHDIAEVGNNLQEALGDGDPRLAQILGDITQAERALDSYSEWMNSAINATEQIRTALMNLGN